MDGEFTRLRSAIQPCGEDFQQQRYVLSTSYDRFSITFLMREDNASQNSFHMTERSEEADQNQISESLALDPREDLAAQELAEALNDISIASPVTTTLHNDNLAKYSESEPPQSTAKRKRSPGFWGEDLIRALQKEPSRIKTANARINAIACIQEGDDILICCALQSGSLRIYNGSTGVQAPPFPQLLDFAE